MNLTALWQNLIPQHFLTRCVGKLAASKTKWLKNLFIKCFIAYFKVDMSTAVETDPKRYENFNAFFTRALKPETRPIVRRASDVACPIDGCVSEIGRIEQGRLLQAKNQYYSLEGLIGNAALATQFENGSFATLYLAPQNYHRIHMPYAGQLKEMTYLPGQLFSVNPRSVIGIKNLFARNERVVTVFETDHGPMILVLVGAMIVGSIATRWEGVIVPSQQKVHHWNYDSENIFLQRGEEMGYFQLGSTVILLFPDKYLTWNPELQAKTSVQMGQLLATITN
jgi:phosphatidylserine decarboxylase